MQIWAGKVLNFSLQSSKLFACKTQDGIDDQTKIARLVEEVATLKKQVELLKDEKQLLEAQLNINASNWE